MCQQFDYIFIPYSFLFPLSFLMKALPLPELRLVYDNHATADNVTQNMRSPVRTILTDREAWDELQYRIHHSIHPSIHHSIHPTIHPTIHHSIHPSLHPSITPLCLEQNCFQKKHVSHEYVHWLYLLFRFLISGLDWRAEEIFRSVCAL